MPQRYVTCPTCGTQVAWVAANCYRPFCSERCRLIDLGAWANEQYRVPVPGAHDATDVPAPDQEKPRS